MSQNGHKWTNTSDLATDPLRYSSLDQTLKAFILDFHGKELISRVHLALFSNI